MPEYIYPLLGTRGRITSGFGFRTHPISGARDFHEGLDIAAPIGTGVVAPISGTITFAGRAGGAGNNVQLRGDDGNLYSFSHLNEIQAQPGEYYGAGQQLGTVGTTGNSTGPHLHYRVRDESGADIDPTSTLGSAVSRARGLAGAVMDIAGRVNPAIGAANGIADALGIGGIFGGGGSGCGVNPICHLRVWLEESDFFQRFALVVLAFIFIAAALIWFSKGAIQSQIKQTIVGGK